jgi:hypothetical protein
MVIVGSDAHVHCHASEPFRTKICDASSRWLTKNAETFNDLADNCTATVICRIEDLGLCGEARVIERSISKLEGYACHVVFWAELRLWSLVCALRFAENEFVQRLMISTIMAQRFSVKREASS